MRTRRRRLLTSGLLALSGQPAAWLTTLHAGPAAAATPRSTGQSSWYAAVDAGYRLQFPRDHGAHPLYRTEWWYLTAWIDTQRGPAGIQLTFFRRRTRHSMDNPSRFAPRQLLFGHAAMAIPDRAELLHAEVAARDNGKMVSLTDTAISMAGEHGDWLLEREADDSYRAEVNSKKFSFSLRVRPPHAPVLQGDNGFSRKGQQPRQASFYYSRPQLAVSGSVSVRDTGIRRINGGTGWLDHEWSSELLDEQAVGWDWVGLNLADNESLMAFRIRASNGTTRFAHARWIRDGQPVEAPVPRFVPKRQWRSPRTNVSYPVEMDIQVGSRVVRLMPLLDDQELDTRRSTGTVYWEGAVQAIEAASGRVTGRGYLELTGYAGKLRL